MKNRLKIKRIVGVGILSALAVVLQLIANYMPSGSPVNLNLALLVITIAGVVYGPFSGALVGAIVGFVIIFAPSTSAFIGHNAFMTVVLCLLKTGLAGLCAGFLFKLIKRWSIPGGIVSASLIVPIVNTGLFLIGAMIFFLPVYGDEIGTLIKLTLTINFLIEFIMCAVLSPTLIYLVKILDKRFNLGISEKE